MGQQDEQCPIATLSGHQQRGRVQGPSTWAPCHGIQGQRRLIYRGDSDLVVQQLMKTFDIKDAKMVVYCATVQELEGKFDGIELHHVK